MMAANCHDRYYRVLVTGFSVGGRECGYGRCRKLFRFSHLGSLLAQKEGTSVLSICARLWLWGHQGRRVEVHASMWLMQGRGFSRWIRTGTSMDLPWPSTENTRPGGKLALSSGGRRGARLKKNVCASDSNDQVNKKSFNQDQDWTEAWQLFWRGWCQFTVNRWDGWTGTLMDLPWPVTIIDDFKKALQKNGDNRIRSDV